ncbi:MAG: HGGxSTG domain-containing protein [Candidatus Nitrotoga sp.]
MIDKVVEASYERRRRWREHFEEIDRLRENYESDDTDYRWRVYPVIPEDLRSITCGARSKRTGHPCKNVSLYRNGRCKFHGGLSTGPKSKAGKRKAAKNGKKGGRPKVKSDFMEY